MFQTGDIKFYYEAKSADTLGPAKIKIENYELYRDPTFETAVLISLFSNARAEEHDIVYSTYPNKHGYFGSVLIGFNFGSKLWLLERSKIDSTTLALYEKYCIEALQWMIDDKLVDEIIVVVEREQERSDQINFNITFIRKDIENIKLKFYLNWQYQLFGGIT